MNKVIYFKGKKIAYTIAGNNAGDCLMLVHGFCEDRSMWEHWLSKLVAEYRVIVVDLFGFGESELLEDWQIVEAADLMAAVLEVESVMKTVFVGHSLGGYIGAAFAEKYGDLLNGLVFFHSTSYADSVEKRADREKLIGFIGRYGTKPFLKAFFKKLLLPDFVKRKPTVLADLKKRAARYAPNVLTTATRAMQLRPDRSVVLATLACPVAFIIGKQDVFVPYEQNLRECYLAKVGSVHLLEEVGHAGMFEASEETLGIVMDFVRFCAVSAPKI